MVLPCVLRFSKASENVAGFPMASQNHVGFVWSAFHVDCVTNWTLISRHIHAVVEYKSEISLSSALERLLPSWFCIRKIARFQVEEVAAVLEARRC